MLPRGPDHLPEAIYPPDEWAVVEKSFNPELLGRMETVFATANGHLGMRGAFEEVVRIASRRWARYQLNARSASIARA